MRKQKTNPTEPPIKKIIEGKPFLLVLSFPQELGDEKIFPSEVI